jgi:hypothetical protein
MGDRPRRKRTHAIKFRTSFSNTIYDVMCSRGWKETDSETDVRDARRSSRDESSK